MTKRVPMTFSLVARCAQTGALGIATTSASIAVGARCPHVSSGTGAITSQNRTDPTLGPALLEALRSGADPDEALRSVTGRAAFAEWRQLAVVDARGRIASYHGSRCSGTHGEARADAAIAIGNLLASSDVPAAMLAAYQATDGLLEIRLLAALDAGLAAGGEINSLRSAALKVAAGDPFPRTDLRVDHDGAPLSTLRALWQVWAPEADKCRSWALDPYSV
jgi:uncharacterized Ntn-hydrolase superfamily protein